MIYRRFLFCLIGYALIALAFSSPARAQATRTWVSGVGDDVNPCSRTAPCKTFAGAISKTADGGEVSCLDPGGFGAVTITKSITLDCRVPVGSILSSGITGIVINANATTGVVTLRNLTINGAGTGTIGVRILAAKAVHVENVAITNHTTAGVQVNASAATSLTLRDVTITDISGSGISLATTSGQVSAVLNDVRIASCATGLLSQGNSVATVHASSLASNGIGILQNAATAVVNVSNTQFANNTTALQGFSGATARVVGSVFSNNATAFNASSGTILTDGQNQMLGNGATGSVSGANPRM